jgi:predicted Zn-dependent peptidase
MGFAMGLASAENLDGDWREAFRWLDRIDRVTAADIMRVATATFTRSNRTVGLIETVTEPAAEAAAP